MEADIFHLANILRPTSRDIFTGKGKLCLSSNYLFKLNSVLDANDGEDINSFQIVQANNTKTNVIKDSQFLQDLIAKTTSLKIILDDTPEYTTADIRKFKNIRRLEVIKLNVNNVFGLQKLRSQIQELTCCRSLKCINEVLEKCGGDQSQPFSWNELRIAILTHNGINEIDNSFESTLSLHTLDLSHNNLTKVDFINLLPNLKHLNLSYNKLDSAPIFKGHIVSRLQVLVLNNNFIEDIAGISTVLNLVQLDLGHNCLLDHKSLLAVSHLVSLQWLNLMGNPLQFHPVHRHLTCNYLNKNASTTKFILDGVILNKNEKSVTGSLYPVAQKFQLSSSLACSLESSTNFNQEKPRKIRNVVIKDENEEPDVKETLTVSTPSTPSQHLEIKKQVEHLRKEYGESWLYRDSGLLVQDVLGFEKSSIMSSTPKEAEIEDLCILKPTTSDTAQSSDFQTATSEVSSKDEHEEFFTAEETIFNKTQDDDNISNSSDNEDILSGGEDCMFLATNTGDGIEVFVVVTDSHISERDVITSKERARWHLNTVHSCEKSEEDENLVKLEFDTLRRDRKQRIYSLSSEEVELFYKSIKEKINIISKTENEKKNIAYQCMKCSHVFEKSKNAIGEHPLICPNCSSKMVVEHV